MRFLWFEVQWFAYGPADATAIPSSLASLKSRLVWPFWCQPTQVVSCTLTVQLLHVCAGLSRDRPATIQIEVKSIDDTSNFDEFPDIDLKWRKCNCSAFCLSTCLDSTWTGISWLPLILIGITTVLRPCYYSDVAQRKPTKLCTIFGGLLGWYTIYAFLGALAP